MVLNQADLTLKYYHLQTQNKNRTDEFTKLGKVVSSLETKQINTYIILENVTNTLDSFGTNIKAFKIEQNEMRSKCVNLSQKGALSEIAISANQKSLANNTVNTPLNKGKLDASFSSFSNVLKSLTQSTTQKITEIIHKHKSFEETIINQIDQINTTYHFRNQTSASNGSNICLPENKNNKKPRVYHSCLKLLNDEFLKKGTYDI